MSGADRSGLRVPPQSVEAEQSLLGGLLMDNGAWDRAADVVADEDFYRHDHRVIYGAIGSLISANRPADIVTVYERLDAAGKAQDVGGLAYLNELAQTVPSAANMRRYAEIVRERAQLRRLIAIADRLSAQAYAPSRAEVNDIIDAACNELVSLMSSTDRVEPVPIDELLVPWIDDLTERAEGKTDAISTGLHDLDRVLAGGVRRGEVMVLAARPSMGKSAAKLGMARRMAEAHVVLDCSLEDSRSMLVSRHVAAVGRVNLADLRRPERAKDSMWAGATAALEDLRKLSLFVDDTATMTLRDVRTKAQQVRRRAGRLDVVVLDYLQLMEGDGETRSAELTAIARGMKRLAKEMNVAVILLSQLSREADKVSGPPRLDHLAESGGIEQAADIIGLLWREARHKRKPGNEHDAQIEIAKNKNGPTDTVRLWFDGATQRFEDYHGGDGDDM